MNAVGNDNYRPGLKPPEPIKQRGGWLSSNMAQLMVFLNGLILTVTAFATLSVFIDEIVKDGLVRTTEEVEQHIASNYTETERSFNALWTILSLSQNQSSQKVEEYLNGKSSGLTYFDELYLLRPGQKIQSFKEQRKLLDSFSSQNAFIDFINIKLSGPEEDIYLSFPLPFNEDVQGQDGSVNSKSFSLIKPLSNGLGDASYLIGVTSFNKIIDPVWIKNHSSLKTIQVTDNQQDYPLYNYNQVNAGNLSLFTNIISYDIASSTVNIKLDMSISARESFLQKIPLLMLLFGITLTLIGTLYVRNNQNQSKKLSAMNKELAHKNFELNQEVSERERLNQVIQKSARENRAIVNSVSDIIFELAPDGKILFLNKSWHTVTGFENERSIGRNLFDLIYTKDQLEQRENFEALISGRKKSYRSFTRLRSSDGSYRAVEMSISMTREDENKELRVVGTITDVEERRRAERALSEAEKKYRTIVENAAGGIYQVTPDGQFLSANPAMARILGYDTPEEILRDVEGIQNKIYVDPAKRERFLNEIKALNLTKNIELQIKRKNGSIIWVSENIRPVKDEEGVLLFFEGSMEDIDQRKKAEIALTNAKVESDLANRAKSEFLANMSHELRTPLNAVIGFSEIIKNEAFGKLPNDKYKDYADDIYHSGNRLLRVINEILDVSRIEAGERTLSETVVKVKETVSSCLELVEGKIKAKSMRVENKVLDTDLSFVGETQAVKQMLLNLMSNAIKFSPENSFMMLDAEIDNKNRLRISVTDTGVGMNDDELEKALSPFGQLNTELNRSKSGTGLGLTLVKSLIELHGGALEIVSQKNIGTTATLIFPAQRVSSVGSKTSSLKSGDAVVEPKEV